MGNTPDTTKLSLAALIALVVGSMVGAGIFSLPATFGRATGVAGALVAWSVAGGGMLMLAFVFQTLAERKPNLESGIFSYALDAFGNYAGFLATLGFWGGCCVANVSFFILVKSTLGTFFPIFGDGNTPAAILFASVLLWFFHILIVRGIKGAAAINTIVTFTKIIPILIFIGIALISLQGDIFQANVLAGAHSPSPLPDLTHLDDYGFAGHAATGLIPLQESFLEQVKNTMLVTVFVFVGIEGASVFSRYAKNRKDVGRATVMGFLLVLALLVLVTVLSYGILPRQALADLRQPSMAGVLEHITGPWGTLFICAAVIVSVLGAYLSWVLLASEVLFSAATQRLMPRFLTRENAKKVPITALWFTNLLTQFFLILTMFTEYAFILALELTSSLCLIPYLLVACSGFKLALSRQTYEATPAKRNKDLVISGIASLYAALMLYSGGLEYLLMSALFYLPCTLLFTRVRKEQGATTVFTPPEKLVFSLIALCAGWAVYLICTGGIAFG